MKNYQWQGELVKVEFGVVYVEENIKKPLFWYNFECNFDTTLNKEKRGIEKGAIIPAVKIYYKNENPFIISNHFGIGVNKLLKGGSPKCKHFSFLDDVKFEEINLLPSYELRNNFKITSFDEESFSTHEAKRLVWQKKNFPKEYNKLERLKKSFKINKN